MPSDVSELIVEMRPEGVQETKEGMQEAEESVEGTTGSLEGLSDEASGFTQSFKGALSAATAGLAVAAAGLLSQVPVIGEAMSGLFAIVEAVAFQMDQVLRPVISPLADAFFNLSGAIFELDGDMASVIGAAGVAAVVLGAALLAPISATTAGVLALAAGAALLANEFGLVEKATKRLTDVMKAAQEGVVPLGSSLKTLALDFRGGIVDLLKAAVSATDDLLGDIATAFKNTDWQQLGEDIMNGIILGIKVMSTQMRDDFITVTNVIIDVITQTDWIQLGKDILGGIILGMRAAWQLGVGAAGALADEMGRIVDAIAEPINDLIADASDWGRELISEFVDGIQSVAGDVGDAVGDVAGGVRDRLQGNSPPPKGPLQNLDKAGPTLIDTFAGGIERNTSRVRNAARGAASAASQGISKGDSPDLTTGGGDQIIEVDGRILGQTSSRGQRTTTASRNIDG